MKVKPLALRELNYSYSGNEPSSRTARRRKSGLRSSFSLRRSIVDPRIRHFRARTELCSGSWVYAGREENRTSMADMQGN